jgi:hypothetical protein
MKILFVFLIFSFATVACNNNRNNDEKNLSPAGKDSVKKQDDRKTGKDENPSIQNQGRYGIKSARVVTLTALPNGMGNTSSTMYFDDYGKVSLTETVTKIAMKGMPSQPKQYSLKKDEFIYTWTEGKKTGTRIKPGMIHDLNNLDLEKLGKEMIEEMKIKKLGTETYLGKTCEVTEMNSDKLGKGKILTWKNIPMLTDMTTMGMNIKAEVKELEENPSLDPAKFEIPADVEFQERTMKL